MRLGTVLRRYRISQECTVRTLAQEIGISAATLVRIESGRPVSGLTFSKLIAWLFAEEVGPSF